MDAQTIITIVGSIASFLLVTLIPSIFGFVKKYKDWKAAKTDAEREKIQNEMLDEVNKLVVEAEKTYASVDEVFKKNTGTGAGTIKKDNVMTKLQSFAMEKGIPFDREYWSKKVDDVVALTKQVN